MMWSYVLFQSQSNAAIWSFKNANKSVYETTLSKVHNIDASYNPNKMAFLRALYIAESISDFIKLNSTGRPSWPLATKLKASPTAEKY